MSDPTTDMYTTLERSVQQKLKAAFVSAGLVFPIFNNMVDKKKFKDSHAAMSIMKVSDVPNFENGGGTQAKLINPIMVDGVVTGVSVTPWPDFYNLMYQIEVSADNLPDVRILEMILRTTLRPRQVLFLWNSSASAFSAEFIEYHYAGYINRDIPSENLYNRVLNIRFEANNQFLSYVSAVHTAMLLETNQDANSSVQLRPSEVGYIGGFGGTFGGDLSAGYSTFGGFGKSFGQDLTVAITLQAYHYSGGFGVGFGNDLKIEVTLK